MTENNPYRIVAEQSLPDHTVRLVEDQRGSYYLQRVSADGQTILSTDPIHGSPSVLTEARALFPDLLPFGGLPVDAS